MQADAKAERSNERRVLDKIATMMRKHHDEVGAIGAVNKPFTFSTRDLQQQIKGQSWIADGGGVDALKAVLMKLEKWLWIYIDEGDERWKPRPDLLDRRW
jgi:hypothetical protein